MSRVLLLLVALMFSVPNAGVAQDDIVKCSWWGPFTAVGSDMDRLTALEEGSAKAHAGMQTIRDHLPDGWFVAGFRIDTSRWTRGPRGEFVLTIRYSVKVCKWLDLPVPDLPKKNRRF